MTEPSGLIYGPMTIWVAPAGTEVPAPESTEIYDPDGPWALLHPQVPDAPPPEFDGRSR